MKIKTNYLENKPLPSSAEVKNAWDYISTSPIYIQGVIQHRNKFIFTFHTLLHMIFKHTQ
jgi:hypothetical protein